MRDRYQKLLVRVSGVVLRRLQAYVWLLQARIEMRGLGKSEWQSMMSVESAAAVPEPADGELRRFIAQRSGAVDWASSYPFNWSRCLQSSMALRSWLSGSGIETGLQVGARRKDGELQMHAWLTHRGRVINDRRGYVGSYSTLGQGAVEFAGGSSGPSERGGRQ